MLAVNRHTGTARMIRVERVVVTLLPLVSQWIPLAVVAMPGERPRDRNTLLGRIVLVLEVLRRRDEV